METHTPSTITETLEQAQGRARDYKLMALYFAEVLSASAGQLLAMKSTSKSERRRQIEILRRVADCIAAEKLYGVWFPHQQMDRVRLHALELLDKYAAKDEKK